MSQLQPRAVPRPIRQLQDPGTLKELVRQLQEGIYVTSDRGAIVDANPAFLDIIGVNSLEELRKLRAEDVLLDPADRERQLERLKKEGSIREYELRIRRRDGQIRTVLDSAYARRDPGTGELYFYGILVDITDRKQLEEQLLDLSFRDPLTGCFNRRYLDEFERNENELGRSWGCIAIDIDHFKEYNDRFGHHVGDDALVRVSRFLMAHTRAEEGVVRMGGDEFVVLMCDVDAQKTEAAARRLADDAGTIGVPFTLGWAARQNKEPLEKTIQRADQRLLKVRMRARRPERRGR
jgi:diguanylate cyclase (GGDEF)-like protein/PAS domain S-box-containing protein